MSDSDIKANTAPVPQTSTPYDYKDLSQDAPNTIEVKQNDYLDEVDHLEPHYTMTFSEPELIQICNALAFQISSSWLFSPKDTIDDDIRASYQALQFLKQVNSQLPDSKKMGCITESLLPFSGGDVYIDATYRLKTSEMGSVISIACFDYQKGTVCFRLFDPVCYPNAKKLQDCLGDRVPLEDIEGIEEVECLTEDEKEKFALGIRNAWENFY